MSCEVNVQKEKTKDRFYDTSNSACTEIKIFAPETSVNKVNELSASTKFSAEMAARPFSALWQSLADVRSRR